MNWKLRLEAFSRTVFSWSSRSLETVQQRVEVLKVFGLSRVYYVASILPMRKYHIKKFESIMGNFIWRGRILRIALDELKNDFSMGGLKLPCLDIMNRALLTSQCIRLLRSDDSKSINHVDFWMGSLLQNVFQDIGHAMEASTTPEYFSILADNLADIMMSGLLTTETVGRITNRMIYRSMASFPAPKIVIESNMSYALTWRRLHDSCLTKDETDCLFLLIHNKLTVPERLFRVGQR